MLHAAAKTVVHDHRGRVPGTSDGLRQLPGVGAYTAGAVASIAFGERAALVDGNVARVLARLSCIEADVKSTAGAALVWALAEELIEGLSPDEGTPGEWNQALMELGATVCTPKAPACGACPVADRCLAKARGVVDRLPYTAPRRAPQLVRRVALVLVSGSTVLLARRRRESLFGGLWEPPCSDGAGRAQIAILARTLGVDPRTARAAGSVEHVLSHRRLQIEVAVAPLGRRRTWPLPGPEYDAVERVSLADLGEEGQRPHATLTRKLLAAAGVARLAKAPRRGVRSTSR
jgi:A/G-specific adenine glycosylase